MLVNRLFLLILVIFLPLGASAAAFCVSVTGLPNDCIYDDPTSCRTRAGQLSGVCTVNTDVITAASGTEKFCIVDSTRVPQCIYVDRTLCEAAQTAGSVCVNNSFASVNGDQPDPFASDPNRNY